MAAHDKVDLWKQILSSLKTSVSGPAFSTWLSQTHLSTLRKTDKERYKAEVGCTSTYVKLTLEKRYYGLIQDALIEALDAPCDLAFLVKAQPTSKMEGGASVPLFSQTEDLNDLTKKLTSANIRPGFTFENFAVSGSNQMAWAACEAVARQPGVAYNPLFVWGGVGVGKTHLMHAVGQRILKENAEARILACSSEEFGNDIISGIRNKTTQAFREKYRRLDALFIDDIQFIAGKDAIQEEFFHTFNAVTNARGQVILTSDKPPTDIPKLEERLRSRFEAGLIVDVAQPDFELRCAIIQIKAEEKSLELSNELTQLIAGNVESARKIEGFLMRLSSEVKIRNSQVDEEMIKKVLGGGLETEKPRPKTNPDEVLDAVSTHFSIGKRAILGKGRTKTVALCRQVLMYLLRIEMGLSLDDVGRYIGGRDHSTVLHGVDKITKMASSDVRIREDIMRIKSELWG